jgi:hypothetical protein
MSQIEVYREQKRAEEGKQQATRSSRKRTADTLWATPGTANGRETRPRPAFRPPVSTSHAQTYNAETARLLQAVLDPHLPRRDAAATVPAPETPVPHLATNTSRINNEPETRAGQPANPDVVAASSHTPGASGMDRAWGVVEGMMKKRRAGHDGDRGEFLLVYSGR